MGIQGENNIRNEWRENIAKFQFGTELETMLRRSDNLVRFTFFARCRFDKLGWAALLVSASVNACIVVLFFQFDKSKARNMLLFANKYTNNLLSTFLLLCSAAFLGVYLSVLKMDRKVGHFTKSVNLRT
jgi:hypothetical protein